MVRIKNIIGEIDNIKKGYTESSTEMSTNNKLNPHDFASGNRTLGHVGGRRVLSDRKLTFH